MSNNPIKKTFRSTLIVGLIPVFIISMITIFVIWGFSVKKSEKDMSITEKEVRVDTVYVEKPCNRNHFDCPKIEPVREKERKRRVDTIKVEGDSTVVKP